MSAVSFTKYHLCFKLFKKRLFHFGHLKKDTKRAISNASFKFEELQITLASEEQRKRKPDPSTLTFGATFSDHMFEVEWTASDGWGVPRILPIHVLQLHPGAKIFHYAQGAFEGMKAFKYTDQRVALFRPELNMKRLLQSAERASLPSFNCEALLKCVKKLVSIDKEWVPHQASCSLYIRPTFIGTEDSLGVSSAKKSLLYVVTCPVGPYFKSGTTTPVSLLADSKYVRAYPGGVGSFKLAANYAPTLFVQNLAVKQGLDQVLWLRGEDHQIAEVGAMNVFFFFQKGKGEYELVTPPLDGTILPGVVRQSILDLTRKWKEFGVSERVVTMSEIISNNKEGKLLEMFICGTACSLCPVKLIRFAGEDINIPTMQRDNPLFARIYTTIMDIQYGRIPSEWSVPVE